MTRARWLILLLGPIPIVLASLVLSQWARSGQPAPPAPNQAIVRGQESNRSTDLSLGPSGTASEAEGLEDRCGIVAEDLARQLGPACRVIVRPPFVIGGDATEAELDRWHERTIGPAARAMARSYFRTPPSEPITVLLFSSEPSYNQYARALYGDEGISVYGYYKPHLRTLVMNISTGGGTLVHELTHALVDFDFPAVPDWFNEGLASLHEECRIRSDGAGIDGLVNWRLKALQEAVSQGTLRPLKSLVADNDFRGRQEALNYAQARYFCLYLQRRGLLERFYRHFRAQQEHDPLGVQSVAAMFPGKSWEELDADFRDWVRTLEPRT